MIYQDAKDICASVFNIRRQLGELAVLLEDISEEPSAKVAKGLAGKLDKVGAVAYAGGMVDGVQQAQQMGLFTADQLAKAAEKPAKKTKSEAA